MKILVIEGVIRENGGLRAVLAQAQMWQRSIGTVRYFVLQRVADESSLEWKMPVEYGQRKIGRMRRGLPLIFFRLLRAVRGADIVVSVSEIGSGFLAGVVAARLCGRPFVVIVHTPLDRSIPMWTPKGLQRLMLALHRRVAAAICVSQGLRESVLANGLPDSRVRVVPNGIDVEAVRKLSAQPNPLAPPPRHPLVVSVGRLSPEKGFDLLIRAHAEVLRRGTSSRLVIVGEGPERPALEEIIRTEGIRESVTLAGFLSNPYPVMASADVFCLSSRFEGFPLVLLEALAVGAPIVSVNCRYGPAETLEDGLYGELVEPESVSALADGLERILHDRQKREQWAASGPGRARQFDPAQGAAMYLDVFSSLVQEARTSTSP